MQRDNRKDRTFYPELVFGTVIALATFVGLLELFPQEKKRGHH